MIVEKEDVDTEIRLPENAQRIYDVLRESGKKMSRGGIAKKIGKNLLNHADMAYLEVMEANEMIVIGKEPARSPYGWQWTYEAIINTQSDD